MRKISSHLLCLFLSFTLVVNSVQAETSRTFSEDERALEFEKAKNEGGGGTSYQQRKLERSKSETKFGSQLGTFSLNYLIYITNYLAGSAIPVLCKNGIVTLATGGLSALLPIITFDNLIFSLGSIISLYTELMIFDDLQRFYANMDQIIEAVKKKNDEEIAAMSETPAPTPVATVTGTATPTPTVAATVAPEDEFQIPEEYAGKSLHVVGLELQRDGLTHEMELLKIKAEAVRATKTAWILSAVVSLASGIIIETARASAMSGGYMALGSVYYGGAALAPLLGVTGVAAIALDPLIYGGDACLPIFSITGSHLAAMGIVEAIKEQSVETGNPTTNYKMPGLKNTPPGQLHSFELPKDVKKEMLNTVDKASSFEEMATALVELQVGQSIPGKSLTVDNHKVIQEALKKNAGGNLDSGDLAALKRFMKTALTENLWKKSNELMANLAPIQSAKAQQASVISEEDEAAESADVEQEVAEASQFTDAFNVYKDVSSVFNSGVNSVNLSKDSTIAKDFSKIPEDPVANGQEVLMKYLSWDFFVKFANYLGFSNGGEIGLIAYITVVGDLAVLKARSMLIHPLVPWIPYVDGSWKFKLVSSIVASFFASEYRKEVLAARKQAFVYKAKVNAVLRALNTVVSGNVTVAGNVGGGQGRGGQQVAGASIETQECINNTQPLGPNSIAPCESPNRNPGTGFEIQDKGFEQLTGNFGGLPAGAVAGLGASLNKLSKGDLAGGRGELNNLGKLGESLAKSLKKNLQEFDKNFPKKKIFDGLGKLEGALGNRYQSALNALKTRAGDLNPASNSFASLAPITSPESLNVGAKGEKGKEADALKKATADLSNFTKGFKMDMPKGNILPSQLSNYSKKDMQDAVKQNFEYTNDDINKNDSEDIFKTITIRYFKSMYPRVFKKKD